MTYLILSLGLVSIALISLFVFTLNRRRKEKRIHQQELAFYSCIAQELHTPLPYISNSLKDLAKDKNLTAQTKLIINKIRERIEEMENYTSSLIEFRSLSHYKQDISVRYSDFSLFIEKTGNSLEYLLDTKHTKLIMDIEPGITLWYDASIISHILNHLMSSCSHSTNKGFVKLSLQHENNTDKVILSLSDSGDGIDKDSASSLSMLLAEELCRIHKIGFDMETRKGVGTTYTLRLDSKEEYPEAMREEASSELYHENNSSKETIVEKEKKANILLVEESTEISEWLEAILNEDYLVHFVRDGKEGASLAHTIKPDIIITAVMLSGMNGIELCRSIKSDPVTAGIPVIILTAKMSSDSRIEAYEAGADSYIQKPIDSNILISRIENILSNKEKLVRKISSGGVESTSSTHESQKDILMKKFMNIVLNNMNLDEMGIDFLAKEMSMSQSTLYRKIKSASGISPVDLIKNIRLDKAAELLVHTDKTIAEIAWIVGINSPVYFRNCFKERFGKTPTLYREESLSSGA